MQRQWRDFEKDQKRATEIVHFQQIKDWDVAVERKMKKYKFSSWNIYPKWDLEECFYMTS